MEYHPPDITTHYYVGERVSVESVRKDAERRQADGRSSWIHHHPKYTDASETKLVTCDESEHELIIGVDHG